MTTENKTQTTVSVRHSIRYAPGNGTAYDVSVFVTGGECVCVVRNFTKLRPFCFDMRNVPDEVFDGFIDYLHEKMGTDAYGISSEITARDIAAAIILLMAEHRSLSC